MANLLPRALAQFKFVPYRIFDVPFKQTPFMKCMLAETNDFEKTNVLQLSTPDGLINKLKELHPNNYIPINPTLFTQLVAKVNAQHINQTTHTFFSVMDSQTMSSNMCVIRSVHKDVNDILTRGYFSVGTQFMIHQNDSYLGLFDEVRLLSAYELVKEMQRQVNEWMVTMLPEDYDDVLNLNIGRRHKIAKLIKQGALDTWAIITKSGYSLATLTFEQRYPYCDDITVADLLISDERFRKQLK